MRVCVKREREKERERERERERGEREREREGRERDREREILSVHKFNLFKLYYCCPVQTATAG